MTFITSAILTVSLTFFDHAFANSKSSNDILSTQSKNQVYLTSFLEKPTESGLNNFRKKCKNEKLFFTDEKLVNTFIRKALETKNEILIRSLVIAVQSDCIDGATSTGLKMDLGNQILMTLPETLITAIFKEKASRLWTVSELENDEWFAVECDDQKCVDRFSAYYESKKNTFKDLKLSKELTVIQKKLIDAIPTITLKKK